MNSLGIIQLNLQLNQKDNLSHTFHVVTKNFPIQVDGILGLDFLQTYKCKINYEETSFEICNNDKRIELSLIDETEFEGYDEYDINVVTQTDAKRDRITVLRELIGKNLPSYIDSKTKEKLLSLCAEFNDIFYLRVTR